MADLKRGSTDAAEIKKMQDQLEELAKKAAAEGKISALSGIHFHVPEKDKGHFGPRTETALRQLQQVLGQHVTGEYNFQTRTGLETTVSSGLDAARSLPREQLPVTPAGKTFTQIMEGYSADKYHCSAGFSTIGYGTSWQKGMPKHIDLATADRMMDSTILSKYDFTKAKFGDSLDKLKPNERDAVLDLTFNLRPKSLGPGTIKAVQDLAACNDPSKRPALVSALADNIMTYDLHHPALQERRAAEAMLVRGDYEQLATYMKSKKGGIDVLDKGNPTGKKLPTQVPDFKQNYAPKAPVAPMELELVDGGFVRGH